MKILAIILALVLFFSQACTKASTKAEVPKQVKSAFMQKFPNAQNAKWDMENKQEWEVEFKLNGKDYSANFTIDGQWKETEYRINKTEIPEAVKATLKNQFIGFKIEVAEISETVTGKTYEFSMEKGDKEIEIAIAPDGKIIKKKNNNEENNIEENDEDND